MFCAISGQAALHPVVSRRTGVVYERDLILKAIGGAQPFLDPTTGEPVAQEDLLDIVDHKAVNPRPPTLSSIPSLLLTLQNEWDANALETYTLKQKYHDLQQQLSNALFENDAAKRVIARLIQEHTEARKALAEFKASAHIGHGSASPSRHSGMDVDVAAVPTPSSPTSRKNGGVTSPTTSSLDRIYAVMDKKALELSTARKGRTMPEGHVTVEQVAEYSFINERKAIHAAKAFGAITLASARANSSHDLTLVGGKDGSVILIDAQTGNSLASVKAHTKKVTAVAWGQGARSHEFYTASADKSVKLWKWTRNDSGEVAIESPCHTLTHHENEVTALSVHPTGAFLLTASLDGTCAFVDIESGEKLFDLKGSEGITAASIHPDGLILGTGSTNSTVQLWDLKSRASVCTFEGHTGSGIHTIAFSENGYFLATAATGDSRVKLWDLRKLSNIRDIAIPEDAEDEGSVVQVVWDESAQFLAIASATHVRFYLNKKWTLLGQVGPLTSLNNGIHDFAFSRDGRSIITCGGDKKLAIIGVEAPSSST